MSNSLDQKKYNLVNSKDFVIAVVETSTNDYDYMQTTTGTKYVNKKIIETKQSLRGLSATPFNVHSSDDSHEAEHSLWILFGFKSKNQDINGFKINKEVFDKSLKVHAKTFGLNGWNNHEDFYHTLANFDDSIIINKRGASLMLGQEHLYEDYSHDIDILTKNRELTQLLLCCRQINDSREQYITGISGKIQRIDIHDWKEEFICPALSATALSQRGISQGGVPVCTNHQTLYYLLLYNLYVNKQGKGFEPYKTLLNQLSSNTENHCIQTVEDLSREIFRMKKNTGYWLPDKTKEFQTFAVEHQYRLSRKEISKIQDTLNLSNISLSDLAEHPDCILRYQKDSPNNFTSKIFKLPESILKTPTPLCLKVIHSHDNNLSKLLRINRHEIISKNDTEYFAQLIRFEDARRDKSGEVFLVLTQWLKGELLSEILKSNKLSNEDIFKICHNLEKLNTYLRKNLFVHADIWERNIMILNGIPYIIDYCNSAKKKDIESMNILSSGEGNGGIRGKFMDDKKAIRRIQKILLNRIKI